MFAIRVVFVIADDGAGATVDEDEGEDKGDGEEWGQDEAGVEGVAGSGCLTGGDR